MAALDGDDLSARWHDVLSAVGVPADRAGAAWTDLALRYDEPGRRYHTLDHLDEVFVALDGLAADEVGGDVAWDPVRLGAFYHDAVYDPRASDNERRSAELARSQLLELGVAAETLEETARLVRLTASHAPDAGDPNGRVLVDADLSILGAPPARYEAYRRAVRDEYAHLDDDAWRAGRSAVVESLLARPALYSTRLARREWEAAARRNLSAELSELRSAR